MITDEDLRAVSNADDPSILVEIYPPDTAPTADGFDPAEAIRLYAETEVNFDEKPYTRIVRSIGRMKKSITPESNSFSVDFDNLSREISELEFDTGLEGLIVVCRLISRSLSTELAKSIILWTGRFDKPTTGTRESLPAQAHWILDTDKECPRRKFTPDDPEGRPPFLSSSEHNPLYEGFRYMPQYGTSTYSERVKRGGLWGLFGVHKRVLRTLQYSSFSDMDAERYLSIGFGRVQVGCVHLAYADIGTKIQMASAFLEGEIEAITQIRTDDIRFRLVGTIHKRYGEIGGTGAQIPVATNWIGNGHYSRTAMVFAECSGTNVQTVDPAPLLIAVCLATKVLAPDASNDWVEDAWDVGGGDNAAAHTRHILTSDDFYGLDENWIDDDSFAESYRFNNELIFDASYSDVLFTPNTASYVGGASEKGKYLASTALATADYFKMLAGSKTASETFLKMPYSEPYDTSIPIEPPIDIPPGGGQYSLLNFFLRRRYTCNVVLNEQTKATDFLHKIIFVSSRLFLTQGANGKLRLKNKKAVDWALGEAAFTGDEIAVDDVTPWITDETGYLLIDPHTTNSEVRAVTEAAYSTDQNSVALTASANITVAGFAGCDGNDTPATATLTVNTLVTGDQNTVELDGVEFIFVGGTADTTHTAAGFIYGTINAHPVLRRRFVATWTPGTAIVTIKGKFGTLTLESDLTETHVAPLSNPTAAPTGAGAGGGALAAGDYYIAYSYVNARGQTLMSPFQTVTITANQKISVDAVTPPAGATSVNWFVSVAAFSYKLRLVNNNNGAAFFITELPKLSASLLPDLNRTGAEVLRVCSVFSDRAEERSSITSSNVLKATYKWRLGNREKAVNRVDLKFRDATQDFRLVEIRLRDEPHINKTKKVSNVEVNGQAIDSYHQAYRIASGMLAEAQDADFFYEWQSDREAILLEEGDVVCITDDGAQVYNLPVRIESIEISVDGGFPKVSFVARKYSTTLYDDSVAERTVPVVIETAQGVTF